MSTNSAVALRITQMRGFTCAVAREAEHGFRQASGLAVGLNDEGADARIAISLRHADGTALTCYLSAAQLDRFANMLAALVDDDAVAAVSASVTLQ